MKQKETKKDKIFELDFAEDLAYYKINIVVLPYI